MGLTGRPLSVTVSAVATTGFLLFGYDQGLVSLSFTGTGIYQLDTFD